MAAPAPHLPHPNEPEPTRRTSRTITMDSRIWKWLDDESKSQDDTPSRILERLARDARRHSPRKTLT